MEAIDTTLEDLFEKVRNLPEDKKAAATRALKKLTTESVYVLSDDELAVVVPALEGALRGELASDEEVYEALYKPWT
jgi:hypothetical protein